MTIHQVTVLTCLPIIYQRYLPVLSFATGFVFFLLDDHLVFDVNSSYFGKFLTLKWWAWPFFFCRVSLCSLSMSSSRMFAGMCISLTHEHSACASLPVFLWWPFFFSFQPDYIYWGQSKWKWCLKNSQDCAVWNNVSSIFLCNCSFAWTAEIWWKYN